MRIKILLQLFIALVLILPNALTAQTLAPNCDTSSFSQYFTGQLVNWGLDAQTAGVLTTDLKNCTDFISCLPTASSLIKPFATRSVGTYCTGSQSCPTDWATVCPECIMAIALIITNAIYFNQTQTSSRNIAFPLASLAANLQTALNSNGTPTTDTCGNLFSYYRGLQCESAIYLGNLYETFAQIGWAKQDAIAMCYKDIYIKEYGTQTNGLVNCIADLLPTLIGTATATAITCPTVPCASSESCVNGTCFPPLVPKFLEQDITNIKNLLTTYITAFTGLVNCCASANQLCQLTLGSNYSTLVLTEQTTGTNLALAGLQNLVSYQTFSFGNQGNVNV